MDYTKPLTKEISCAPDWGIQKVLFRDSGLTGDINAGSDALKQLAALREFQVSGNAGLTGTFPAFLAEMPDLFGFGLANTSLEGPIPDLRGLPNLASIDVTGAKFSGPLPPLKREIQGLAYTGPSYSTCRLASSDSGLCWQYDRSAYDPVCLDSNPAVRSCAAPAAFTVGPLQPSGTSSAASTSAPAAEPSSVNVGAIVGGVIGGLVLLALLAFLGYRLFRKPAPAAPAPAPAPEEPKPEAKPEMLAAPEEKPRRMSFRDRRMSVDTLATAHSVSNADVVMTPTAAMSRQA
ncbi:hypothetical protein DFJ74DRAFT_674703 [Hyaloraphidium curvatum]|nr:hypothetical protein DFJ74DRAFT_674703 [Hyaloraphidium curvatum]